MKLKLFCDGKFLKALEHKGDKPSIGEEFQLELYNRKTQVYSYRLYEVVEISGRSVYLSPLFIED